MPKVKYSVNLNKENPAVSFLLYLCIVLFQNN